MSKKVILCLGSDTGGLQMSQEQSATLRQFSRDQAGRRIRIELSPQTPESRKQRAFYHGAVIPLIAYFQEGMDYRNYEDLAQLHEWLKIELNGEFIEIKGKAIKVGKSTTKGELPAYVERVIEWMTEQGYPVQLLNPAEYKYWDTKVFPYGGPETYLGYLIETGRLQTPESYTV
jgi:hypothetical protein